MQWNLILFKYLLSIKLVKRTKIQDFVSLFKNCVNCNFMSFETKVNSAQISYSWAHVVCNLMPKEIDQACKTWDYVPDFLKSEIV